MYDQHLRMLTRQLINGFPVYIEINSVESPHTRRRGGKITYIKKINGWG